MGNLMSNKTKEEREALIDDSARKTQEVIDSLGQPECDPIVLKAEEVFMIIKLSKKYPYHDQTIRDVYLMIGDWDKTEECLSTSATLGHNPELVAKIMTS